MELDPPTLEEAVTLGFHIARWHERPWGERAVCRAVLRGHALRAGSRTVPGRFRGVGRAESEEVVRGGVAEGWREGDASVILFRA